MKTKFIFLLMFMSIIGSNVIAQNVQNPAYSYHPSDDVSVFFEDFETGDAIFSSGWYRYPETGIDSMWIIAPDNYSFNGYEPATVYASVNDDVFGKDSKTHDSVLLLSPKFSLVDLNFPILQCDLAHSIYDNGGIFLFVTIDGGYTFDTLASLVAKEEFEWHTSRFNLSAYVGEPEVQVAFYYSDRHLWHNWGVGPVVDNVVVYEPSARNDLAIVDVQPFLYSYIESESPTVTVRNDGTIPLNEWSVKLSNNDGYTEVFIGDKILAVDEVYSFQMPVIHLPPDSYNFELNTLVTGDVWSANDTLRTVFYTYRFADRYNFTGGERVGVGNNDYYSYNFNTNDTTLIVNSLHFWAISSHDFCSDGAVYRIYEDGMLFKGDAYTGEEKFIHHYLPSISTATIAYGGAPDVFMYAYNSYDSTIYALDTVAKTETIIGSATEEIHAIECAPNGDLYGVGTCSDSSDVALYKFNFVTGVFELDRALDIEQYWNYYSTNTAMDFDVHTGLLLVVFDKMFGFIDLRDPSGKFIMLKEFPFDAKTFTSFLSEYTTNIFVADNLGIPIENAMVTIDTVDYFTGISGKVSKVLADGHYDIVISKSGYQTKSDFVVVAGADFNRGVTLLPYYTATFNVTDGTDAIANATVELTGYGTQTTDALGQTVFANVVPQSDIVYNVTATGFDTQMGSISVVDGAVSKDITLILTGYEVTFNVTDGTDAIANATVELTGYGTLTTDVAGQAIFNNIVPAADIAYTVTATGFDPQMGSISVVDGAVSKDITLILTTYEVTFNVTDGTDAIANATVELTGYGTQTTDALGQTVFANVVPQSDIVYNVTATGFDPQMGSISVVDGAVSKDITLILTTYEVTFNVTDGTDAIANATVELTGYGTQTTDALGQTVFANVVPQSDIVYTVSATGFDTQMGSISVVAGDVSEDVIMVLTTYTATFNVTDDTDAIANATVELTGYGTLTTDVAGQAIFNSVVPAADIAYTVTATGFDTQLGSISVVAGDVSEDVIMVLTTYTATFNVTDGIDAIEGASITINGETLMTGITGVAAINLANGNYDFNVTKDGYEAYSSSVTVADAGVAVNVSMVGFAEIGFDLSIYPNPATGLLNIQTVDNVNLKMFNAIGDVVYVENFDGNTAVDVSGFSRGTYLILIEQNGKTVARRIVLE